MAPRQRAGAHVGAKPLTLAAPRGAAFGLAAAATAAVGVALPTLAGCTRATPPPPAASSDAVAATASTGSIRAILRAEDLRRAKDVPPDAQRSHDPSVRRLAARAFARILAADDAPLLRALEDSDGEVVAWAAYGLGESCKGREDAHVRAIAARLASFVAEERVDASGPPSALDAPAVMLRALGRCGGEPAERTLRTWILRRRLPRDRTEPAAYALGDIASSRGALSLETAGALLGAVDRVPPLDAALYAFGRMDLPEGGSLAPRLVAAARSALGRPGPARVFAVRALGRSKDPRVATDLAHVLASADASAPERVEAARALARLGDRGRSALLGALDALAPADASALSGDGFAVLFAAVSVVPDESPNGEDRGLRRLARLAPNQGAAAAVLRRAAALRCAAAAKLSRGVWDSGAIRGCDLADGEAGERARLTALDDGLWAQTRRTAWLELVRSRHLRVDGSRPRS